MITRNDLWQQSLKEAVTDVPTLLAHLQLQPHDIDDALILDSDFPLRVPLPFIARMQMGDPNDPLLRQVLPVKAETRSVLGFTRDPLGEQEVNPVPGLLHKYYGRVLLTVVGGCAVHCRYCFRRHFPYEANSPGKAGWEEAVAYIEADSSIREVILSGGDPLLAPDSYLDDLTQSLRRVPHLTTLRIHTRLPVVIPSRVNESLVTCLKGLPWQTVLVLHCNHPNEVDGAVIEAMAHLRQAGVMLLNQSVLLQGINDDSQTLKSLSEKLFAAGVLPYYLHQLDPVEGAAHFDVLPETASQIYEQLRSQVPGYLLPTFVKEAAGADAKIPVGIA